MKNIMQTIGLLEMALTCATLLVWLLQRNFEAQMPVAARIILALLLTNLFYWPLGLFMQLPLAAYIRGVTGDLSVVSLLLLWSSVLLDRIDPRNTEAHFVPMGFKVAIVVIAFSFYPFALGLGMLDPYGWGYASIGFLIAVSIFAAILAIANWSKGTFIIALAILAWSIHWHESANLWDYLLDPFLMLWALLACISSMRRKRRERLQSGFLFRAG
ncbi:hypothetical protein G6687_06075 [Polynucleobacter paneuropaeus]|uniref:hypothetical protein n=1 Tax=Polynucleobacter paneuropaeus TaxID=2527775 RepID=UPI000DBF3623|nr:hypothetical protein [Polynucleobacter paneuropaeus]AWW48232.1 hypothetical protein DPM17_06020 [Polynucleobacter paneuropaeus]MBT8522763.1 hypothetical protein [Polynucleobacter paneuropaeus]MBT8563072.1 hypothetical protein [Polynucleobacter paneuropaeus]MBT8575399.1 hypothetical protein [Polynucleobacter paneuropaeus]MBT8593054.1 hypothetical protein [Polynucleobacter paneuropaeus]